MTTAAYSTVMTSTSDATFRAWGSEISAKLLAVGLTQTADTGQINWATVAKPAGGNTAAGYEIWRFNDTLHGTVPIFIKIEFGTGDAADVASLWCTVGSASSGAGAISGTTYRARVNWPSRAGPNPAVPYKSYMVYNATLGFWGFMFKEIGFFCISRSCDDTGAATGDAVVTYTSSNSLGSAAPTSYSLLTSTSYTPATAGYYCLIHYAVTASLVGTDIQVYKHYHITPRVRPLVNCCTVINAEVPINTSFTATLVGSTSRTYIATGSLGASAGLSTNYGFAMLWE